MPSLAWVPTSRTIKCNRSTDDLLDPECLPKEDDPGGYAHHGDQILVDQNPVRPDAADPPLPPGEAKAVAKSAEKTTTAHEPTPTLPHSRSRRYGDDRTSSNGAPKTTG